MVAPPVLRSSSVCAVLTLACLLTAAAAEAQRVWSPPVTLTPPEQQSKQPQLAIDASGRAVATWTREQASGPTSRVTQGARMATTGFWGRPQNLYSPAADLAAPSEATDVALNAAGRGAAVWVRATSGAPVEQIVQAAVYTGTGWGGAVNVMPASAAGVGRARVGVDNDGNAIAVWVQTLNGFAVLRGARYAAGGAWSAPVTISSPTEHVSDEVALDVDAEGNAAVAWTATASGAATVRAAQFLEAAGTWSEPVAVAPAGRAPYTVRLVLNRAGTVGFVAFRGFNGANDIARAARLDPPSGAWSAAVDLSSAGQNVFDLDIAVDEPGRAVAVWGRFDGTTRTIQTARYDGAWSTPANRTTGAETREARVDTDAAGNAVAVWTALDGTVNRVQASVYSPITAAWSPAANVSATDRDASAPRVRAHTDGSAVLVWQSQTDFFYIQSSRYVLAAAPTLQPPTVDRNIVSLSWSPGVGPPPDGYTVVAATSPGGPTVAVFPVGRQTTASAGAWDGAYYVRVIAQIAGQQVASNEVEVIVGNGGAPTAPQDFTAVVNGNLITMTWTAPANVPPVTLQTYYVEAGSMEGISNLAFFPTGNTLTTYVSPPVANGSYWVRVRGLSAAGLGPASSEVRVIVGPPPPGAPVLSGGATGPGTVALQWTPAPAPGVPVAGYQLRAGYQPGQSNAAIFNFPASTFAYAAGGIPPGSYYVRVVALSSAGPGAVSNEIVVTIP